MHATLGCRVGVEELVKDVVVVHLHLYAKEINFVCSHFNACIDLGGSYGWVNTPSGGT